MCINVTELKILGKTYRTIGEKWENKIRYLVLTVKEEEEEVGGGCRIIVIGVIRVGITWWGILLLKLEILGLYSEKKTGLRGCSPLCSWI